MENDGKGGLIDKTSDYGLNGITGLWNTIEFVDLNHDGRLDILAGNAGLNLKWTASETNPVKIYVGDFDGNGATEPLIFYRYFSRYIPNAGLITLLSQLPVLHKKFVTYSSFKNVSEIKDLIENYKDKVVEQKNLTELGSMFFLSEEGKYKGYRFNFEEQMSDINDFQQGDDGRIYYVGNHTDYISDMGAAMSNSGRILGRFVPESKSFEKSSRLPLPVNINPRKIQRHGSEKLVVACNNGYQYLISTRNNIQ